MSARREAGVLARSHATGTVATAYVLCGLRESLDDEFGAVPPVKDLAASRPFQVITQCATGKQGARSEQVFDGSKSARGVAVVEPGANVVESVRTPVRFGDRLQARQSGTAQCRQQFLAAYLVGVVV